MDALLLSLVCYRTESVVAGVVHRVRCSALCITIVDNPGVVCVNRHAQPLKIHALLVKFLKQIARVSASAHWSRVRTVRTATV